LSPPRTDLRPARLRTRLLALVYEALILAALLLIATGIFTALAGDSRAEPQRSVLRLVLVATAGVYFVWSWTGGRRTLPMRTWRVRIVDLCGRPPNVRAAVIRYVLALVGIALGGIGLLWALVDRDRQFLHDRIAGTRLIADDGDRASNAAGR
jgi:uncharacterized RDD family membrane protein YckC